MPVEDVELVERHQVERAFHGGLAEEVPRIVDMHAAPAEPRRILDLEARECELPEPRQRELLQRLKRIEAPRFGRGRHRDALRLEPKVVSLLRD